MEPFEEFGVPFELRSKANLSVVFSCTACDSVEVSEGISTRRGLMKRKMVTAAKVKTKPKIAPLIWSLAFAAPLMSPLAALKYIVAPAKIIIIMAIIATTDKAKPKNCPKNLPKVLASIATNLPVAKSVPGMPTVGRI